MGTDVIAFWADLLIDEVRAEYGPQRWLERAQGDPRSRLWVDPGCDYRELFGAID